jgi:inner membrane protein
VNGGKKTVMHNIAPWAIWLILSAALIVGEILTAGVFLIFFGIGAIPASIVAYFHGSPFWQLITFCIASGLLVGLARPLALKLTKDAPDGIGSNRMIGKTGIVLDAIDPKTGGGRVRVEREEWRAESETGETIPAETWIEVLRIEGARLVVKPIEKTKEEQQS